MLSRREENAALTQKIGDLNRQLGAQDAQLDDLKAELTNRTILMGESSGKLLEEKKSLQDDLAAKTAQLTKSNATLTAIKTAQAKRSETLNELQKALTAKFPAASGVTAVIDHDQVLLTLPDAKLFETTGIAVSANGKTLLKTLAEVLTSRPEINVHLESHTDNALPKDKTIKDTWDWSLLRATNLVRLLISDYNVNANQLTPVGRGEFYPIASNETPEGRQKNRRTVLVLMPKLAVVPAVE